MYAKPLKLRGNHTHYFIGTGCIGPFFSENAYQISFSPWWRHQMEPVSALLALCAGNSSVPVNSPHKDQWRGAFYHPSTWQPIKLMSRPQIPGNHSLFDNISSDIRKCWYQRSNLGNNSTPQCDISIYYWPWTCDWYMFDCVIKGLDIAFAPRWYKEIVYLVKR